MGVGGVKGGWLTAPTPHTAAPSPMAPRPDGGVSSQRARRLCPAHRTPRRPGRRAQGRRPYAAAAAALVRIARRIRPPIAAPPASPSAAKSGTINLFISSMDMLRICERFLIAAIRLAIAPARQRTNSDMRQMRLSQWTHRISMSLQRWGLHGTQAEPNARMR